MNSSAAATLKLALLILTLIASVPAKVQADDWPMFGHDAQRTFASSEKLPDRLQSVWKLQLPALTPAWLDQTRVRTDAVYRPIVVGTRMIVASSFDDSVTAYNLADGREAWRFFTAGPIRYSPAVENGRVFVGSDDGYLYALAAADGKLLWKLKAAPKSRPVLGNGRVIDTWCVRGGPVVEDGKVYFAAGLWPFMGVFVCSADAVTGKMLWSNSGDGSSFMIQPHGAPSFGGLAPQGALALAGDRLLVPNGRAMPASLDRATGAFQYFQLNNKNGGDRVSVGRNWFFNDSQVFHPENGVGVASISSAPVIVGDTAYTVDKNEIEVHDVSQPVGVAPVPGKKKLKTDPVFRLPKTATDVEGVEVIAASGGRLYVGCEGKVEVYALPLKEEEATPLFALPLDGTPADLVIASGHLIVTTEQGAIHCFGEVAGATPAKLAAPSAKAVIPAGLEQARQLLKDCTVDGGYAVVLGAASEGLARGLIAASEQMHVTIIEPDAAQADALRTRLQRGNLYGSRIAVRVGDISNPTLLPPYFANLVVAEGAVPASDTAIQGIYRLLHPYRGTAYLAPSWKPLFSLLSQQVTEGRAVLGTFRGSERLARRNGLSGAGSWTHEHADASNTRVSSDSLAKAPLGILWYGGSSHEGILPRHGHGPQPQVIGGRIYILGMDMLRSMDAYTGRVLWEAAMPGVGAFYDNTAHHPGANGVGTNFITTPDAVYVALRDRCVLLDPINGKTIKEYTLPADLPGRGKDWVWSYLNVTGDYLVGSGAPPMKGSIVAPTTKPKDDKEEDDRDDDDDTKPKLAKAENPRTVGSRVLFVMNRHTGEVLWSRAAVIGDFRNNAICLGGNRLFAIDRPPFDNAKKRFIPGSLEKEKSVARLHALDLATGKELWTASKQVFGTWLGYSTAHDVLIETGRSNRDSLGDEVRGMRAYNGSAGDVLWYDQTASGPAMLRGATVMKDKGAADLKTGKPIMMADPITGVDLEWGWTRNYGCNTPAGSQNLLTFRSGAAGFFDLARNGGTGNFGGFRSSCTNNLIVADGLICAPDYTRTCTCSYPLQTSLALIPDDDVEVWTFVGRDTKPTAPVRRVGVNFGAPGDRVDDAGTLWLEYPPSAGKSPKVKITVEPKATTYFRQHTTTIDGDVAWVAASGARGMHKVKIDLADEDEAARRYTVKLIFAQPAAGSPAGKMDIKLQGKRVETGIDVQAAAGGPNRSLVREYHQVEASEELVIELESLDANSETILSGVEVVAETPSVSAATK